jgi:hypothetical protein
MHNAQINVCHSNSSMGSKKKLIDGPAQQVIIHVFILTQFNPEIREIFENHRLQQTSQRFSTGIRCTCVQEGGPSGSITSPGQPISSETRSYFNHVARHLSSKVTSGGGKLTVVEINIIGLFRLIKLI